MDDKFIERIIDDFFQTGVLRCSILQLHSIYKYTVERLQIIESEKGFESIEFQVWLNFYRMLVTYQVETSVDFGSNISNLKVSFKDYLKKVYNMVEGELDSVARDVVYQRYVDFTKQNCCEKCLYLDIQSFCSKCPCGDIWKH